MAIPINLRTTGSVMVVEGTTPLARMEINVPLTASSLSINTISLTSGSVAGDLIINGTLIANEFKTTITSASITYRSGSTKQGDSLDDIHEVTGSLRMSTGSGISGSLSGSFFGVTQGSVQGTEGLTGSLQRLVSGLTYLVAGTRILITTQSNGQIQIDAIAADVSGSYITIGNTGSLPNERALQAGTGIIANDGGPGNVITLLINNNVVATLSGSTFQGPVVAGYGLSGSVQRLDTGQTYLAAGPNVSIQSQSSGQVIISAVGLADVSASYIVFGTTGSLPNERAIQAGAGIAFIDNGVGGSLIVKATGEGSADVSGSYVTLDTTGSLPNERRLAASTGIQIIDNGPGATVDVAINNNVVATITGANFTGPVTASGGLEFAPRWDDLQGVLHGTTGTGQANLTYEDYEDTGFKIYFMRHDQDDEFHVQYQMPHAWDYTTTVYPHIHLLPAASASVDSNVRFEVAYTWLPFGQQLAFSASWTVLTVDYPISGSMFRTHSAVELGAFAPPVSGSGPSNLLFIKTRRLGTDPNDTFTDSKGAGTAAANLGVLYADVHYQLKREGTTVRFGRD